MFAALFLFEAIDNRLSSAGKRSTLEQRLVMQQRKRRVMRELRRVARNPHTVNPNRSRAEMRRGQTKWR